MPFPVAPPPLPLLLPPSTALPPRARVAAALPLRRRGVVPDGFEVRTEGQASILQRANDVLLSIPLIVAALVVVAVLGKNMVAGVDVNLMLAIILPYIPVMARVMRTAAMGVRVSPYIDAARALGFSHLRIIVRHMLPNLVSPWLVMVSAFTAQTILLEASLSFLGVGVSEPTPAWGLMLSGVSVETLTSAPWVILFPGLAISLTVFSFSLLGDALRDALDPRTRH